MSKAKVEIIKRADKKRKKRYTKTRPARLTYYMWEVPAFIDAVDYLLQNW